MRLAAILYWLVFVPVSGQVHTAPAGELELKAEYIYNFARFTVWPAGSFADARSPLRIGILGNDRLAEALVHLVSNQEIRGRAVIVHAVALPAQVEGLHMLYVATADEALSGEAIETFDATGLLTVGEAERFIELGGAIRFVIEDRKLQFEINTVTVERAGIRLSSQVLMLARTVHREP